MNILETVSLSIARAKKKYWDHLFELNVEQSIWVEEEDLGTERVIHHKGKNYSVKIPQKFGEKITLRLRGIGKTRGNKTGDLLLHVWLNKGEDIHKTLWLSETSARNGAKKILALDEKKIMVVVPPKSHHGLNIRLKGLGKKPNFYWRAPLLQRKRGHLLVKLCVYPDRITPHYRSFDLLSTDDMYLEGWVYRKIDEVIDRIGQSPFTIKPMQADTVADIFNEQGWTGIFHALVSHLNLTRYNIEFASSDSISVPGTCQKTVVSQGKTPATYNYTITVNGQFLDNPFSVAAILAHELCHIIYSEKIDETKTIGYVLKSEQETLADERTVDLLLFMFKVGEFQLRVARDKRLTLGYFNQEIFDRIQVIVSKKLGAF